MDMGQPKTPADESAIAKNLFYLLRTGIGRHIEVLRLPPQQQVAYPATDQKRLVTGFSQPIQNL
jgi:hypothetical protein